ncbi:host attachment family protein [Rubellimicrobium aerolatum]|uniref:Host attachment family protein n=1 Tax=Rubellimicrobium aerolatum TaxID=490979 RepID=A0ABW0SBD9_9RHOB|nr:host attachment family protein [Rubellimicrobium aerolatum]MBP1805560.1 protein required for attachment to host cells [Rubellimicrobium aerolatum]
MQLENGTWVLVLDGTKALIFENITDGQDPNLRILRKEENAETPDEEVARGVKRTEPATGSTSDTHRSDEHRFVEDLAEQLYTSAHQGKFDRLVVVAGPNHLGTLRAKLHKEVADRIVGEVHKTLTGHPVDQIERIVAQELASA